MRAYLAKSTKPEEKTTDPGPENIEDSVKINSETIYDLYGVIVSI